MTTIRLMCRSAFYLLSMTMVGSSLAAQTDLADTPLASQKSDQVKPNLLFILDDSGSMDDEGMPDGLSSNTVGYRNNFCNYVAYNRAVTYAIPPAPSGGATLLNENSQTSFTTAYDDGYGSYTGEDGTSNLSNRYYWVLNNPTTDTINTTLTPETGVCNLQQNVLIPSNSNDNNNTINNKSNLVGVCYTTRADKNYNNSAAATSLSTTGNCPNGQTLVWRKVIVSNTSGSPVADERQNYANWYSYYRSRLMMMKAAVARSIITVTDAYRLGFMTIHPGTFNETADTDSSSNRGGNGSDVSANKFLKVSDFDVSQRTAWFTKLYQQTTTGSTPLRTALSVAGRYFAGKNDGINQGMIPTAADDPVQYSCQRNFSILTTDGYWNRSGGISLDGTNMVNNDGNLSELDAYNPLNNKIPVSPRPIYDGGTATYVNSTASIQYQRASCVYSTQEQTRTVQLQQCSTPRSNVQIQTRSGGSWGAWTYITGTVCNYGTNTNCQGGQLQRYRNNRWNDDNGCTPSNETCRRIVTAYTCPNNDWANNECTNTNNATTPLCRTQASAWSDIASCDPVGPDGNGAAVQCQDINTMGYKVQYKSTINSETWSGPGKTGQRQSTASPIVSNWTDLDSTCYATQPTLPTGGTVTGNGPPTPPAGCTSGNQVWPCETYSSTGGSVNTLADVAQHYYKTDLRPGNLAVPQTDPLYGTCAGGGALGGTIDVCTNNVSTAATTDVESDRANWQHMSTFTMGLGLSGTLPYSSTYKTDSSGTFANIRAGTTDWPVPDGADGQTPINTDLKKLDDLWHAAVNGRGLYFSATDPDSVITGLKKTLNSLDAAPGAASAAATSNLEPVAGDNYAYTAQYKTQAWTGDLQAREIDLLSGEISGTAVWSAQEKLDTRTKAACDNRTIKLFRAGAANNLVDFTWNTYACDSNGAPTGTASSALDADERTFFGSTQVSQFSHFPNMGNGNNNTVDQISAAAGANMVNFIRGQRGKEGFSSNPLTNNDLNKLYRAREHVLGDIVNAQPVFVRGPFAEYVDGTGAGYRNPGYSAYKAAKSGRPPMVYVAANDGMLHAFYSGTSNTDPDGGKEAWAFIPSEVLPNLHKLASENYANNHHYYVDGTPTAADIYDKTVADCGNTNPIDPSICWKTILVGGLNKGGKGYYAMDITDPLTPKALWEFNWSSTCYNDSTPALQAATNGSDCHIGYTFGRPLIAKLGDDTWAAFVPSGHNNDDGKGYLYVLNAATGKIIYRLGTNAGSSSDPSGLNAMAGWTNDGPLQNNRADRLYGGDLLGNLWRFDINDVIAPNGREATLVTTVVDSSGQGQPITTRPRLALVGQDNYVYVGTGRYLGISDKATTQQQTIWAIRDPMTQTAIATPRTTLASRTMVNVGTDTNATRTITNTNCGITTDGWYIDLPDLGERVNIDMQLQLGTLIAASNVPAPNACNVGGYAWLNFVNYKTGCAVANSNGIVGNRLASRDGVQALAVGLNVVRLPSGQVKIISTDSAGGHITSSGAFELPGPDGRRVTWREIIQ